jgi:hypothetical protein
MHDLEALRRSIEGGFKPKFVFFWGHEPQGRQRITKTCLSQWYPAAFTIDGQAYPTAEHWMMAEKARLFNDTEMCAQILAAPHPGAAKALGRQVAGFDHGIWTQHRQQIVIDGSLAKYRQNAALQQFLVQTGARVLAEASPQDRIWGIGLAENDSDAQIPAQWPGLNLLGFALMRVRSALAEGSF